MSVDRIVLEPFADFEAASRAALDCLQLQLGMSLWMVTRAAGEDQIVLGTADRNSGYPIHPGDVYRWSDGFCARMVAGRAPQYAPRVAAIEAYARAPVAQALTIGAYVGIPLRRADGALFGTLCAIDPSPQSDDFATNADPLLQVIGRLLATVLDRELQLTSDARRIEKAEAAAMVDQLTGLWNRRAWEHFRETEEARCRRYGHSACMMSIDLDGLKHANDTYGHEAGDELLRGAARALKGSVREQDVVARIGGDEFAVLLVECDEQGGGGSERRVRDNLARLDVAASIGFARREASADLTEAWSRADEAMYRDKRARKGATG